jgi:hypothetical protein
MTKWQSIPLRQPGRPWPGLNTRGGRIDDGSGQLEDGSFNMVINEADIMAKRNGLVRGLNERFSGVVCGLFKYTDLCGREFLLVADEEQISIRTPFVIPVFQQSDAYPFDAFDVDGNPNSDNWRNTGDYTVRDDGLFLASGATAFTGSSLPVARLMRWFKDASNKSYRVRVEYEFDDDLDGEQRISISIKGNGDLSSGALLKADLTFNRTGTYEVELFHRAASGAALSILKETVTGILTPPSGFFTLLYTRNIAANTYIPSVQVVPSGGSIVNSAAETLTVIEDADLGQVSSIGMGYRSTLPNDLQVKVVDGGPVS